MTGYFVTDDERGRRILSRGTPDDPLSEYVVRQDDDPASAAVFDAAAAVLAPDDALIERVARALTDFWFDHPHLGPTDEMRVAARAALAAVREEAGR